MSLDRLSHRLESWKRQLIDLSRRNRLLNYRPTRASTVEIVDEVPQIVLRHLLAGGTFRFDPKPEPGGPDIFDGEAEEDGRNWETGRALVAAGGDEVEEHHRDDRLQTTLVEKRLEANLLAIFRRAEESIEEQGVNTLFLVLGMLEWHEGGDPGTVSRAPLLMVPVALRRQTAASDFVLTAGDDEPFLNPALAEKLRLDFRIQLADLPEFTDDLDVEQVFDRIRDALSGFPTWRLTSDMALGLFSFQKFIMYRDLERNEGLFREHPIIRAVCGEGEAGAAAGLPPEVAEADLDEEMAPWSSVQVLDADSSQQRAVLAVKKGHDLVIEGPPGTGKSQTITNLVADALHDGKTVLFVAEKMAALEVVKSRLEHDAGLGGYVLELHSNKASKREFVETLTRALDRVETGNGDHAEDLARLKRLTGELREYVVQLHAPLPPLGKSPYEGIAALASLEEAARLRTRLPGVGEASAEDLSLACERLDRLARALAETGDPGAHPLRGLGLEAPGRGERTRLEETSREAGAALSDLTDAAWAVADLLGLRSPETLGDAAGMVEGAITVARSPGADAAVLEDDAWNDPPAEVLALLEAGERYAAARPQVEKRFRSGITARDLRGVTEWDLPDEIAEFASHLDRGFWRWLVPGWYGVRKRVKALFAPGYRPEGDEGRLRDLRAAQACREALAVVQEQDGLGRRLFGGRWRGSESDWSDLRAFSEWVVRFRACVLKDLLGTQGVRVAATGGVDADEADRRVRDLDQGVERARAALEALREAGAFGADSGISSADGARLGELAMRVAEVEGGLDGLRAYAAFVASRNAAGETIARDWLTEALGEGVAADGLVDAFRRTFFEQWVDHALGARPVLGTFHAAHHEERIDAFRRLDLRSLDMAESRTLAALAARRQDLMAPGMEGQLQILQREARKRSRIMPVRKLLARTPDAIQRIKPCFMMSPLSVAQYLDPERMKFDLVVFDEASQIVPSDAVGAIVRASRVVVVGDSKQLPPTNFFGVHLDDADMEEDEELEMLGDLESILDEVAVSGIPSVRLKWHYRSQHPSLFRFSNEAFYSDDPLYVFPSATREQDDLGLKFELVDGGVYEGGGRNTVEARRVAEAVVEHVRTSPEMSLGVGTFGIKQQELILDEIDRLRRQDPSLEWFFHQEGEKKFFVKNLENIQGDDRDVIFLSVTYGPDVDGIVRRNFGPINLQGGWRRLNVLTTRSKRLMRVFSSMRAEQIDLRNINAGASLLRTFLKYAETGEYPAANIPGGGADSPFETAVMRALERRGYRVVSQVGDAGYRIDIGVIDPDLPGRYICGVECDGATYRGAATVRDRDRLRQQVLELRGWDIYRVWSTDWFQDPKGQIDRLAELIEGSRERLRNGVPRGGGVEEVPVRQGGPGGEPASEEDEEAVRTPLEEIEVPPYRFADLAVQGTQDAFYTVPVPVLAGAVRQVLAIEAPVHASEICRRIASAWGMNRIGSQIVNRVDKAIAHLVSHGAAVREDDFVRTGSDAPCPVRSRTVDGETFSSDHIAPCEVVEAVRLLLRHRAPLLPDELVTETARLLGFARTGPKLRERIEAAKEDLVARGELRPGSRGIHLANPRT